MIYSAERIIKYRKSVWGNNIYALMPMLQEGYKETAKHFIKTLGCADKAWKAEQCVSSGLKQDLNEAK